MFDEEVREFLTANPEGSVIEIGAGLNTRYERLDNGRASWLESDLPDSMALRKRFFTETDRRRMISADVLDTDWHEVAAQLPPPYCFVSEAVIIYLDDNDAKRALASMARRFPGATLVMDTTSGAMVDDQHNHDAMKTMSSDSWFRWRCDDPSELSEIGLDLVRSYTFLDASPEIRNAMPLFHRFVFRWMPWVLRRKLEGYRINRFTLANQRQLGQ